MRLKWDESAWEEYTEIQARDKQMLKRINMLVKDTMRSPFEGIGKPEGLKWNLQGYWSRRIDDANRLVYTVKRNSETGEDELIIASCRYHYDD